LPKGLPDWPGVKRPAGSRAVEAAAGSDIEISFRSVFSMLSISIAVFITSENTD
jgi:hypothetical protein